MLEIFPGAALERASPRAAAPDERHARPLVVAVVGGAGKAADSTSRRFGRLLHGAAGGARVEIRRYGLGASALDRNSEALRDWRDMVPTPPDAVIVTGAEPTTSSLEDEPFWVALTGLFGWAEGAGVPLLLSCLAAHAAALHRHGVRRQRLGAKCFGVFQETSILYDGLLDGVPAAIAMPHSRWHALAEDRLRDAGYRVLTRSDAAGVGIFVEDVRGCPWLHLQGHPEYGRSTLVAEWQRDMARFIAGNGPCPEVPAGGLDDRCAARLVRFAASVRADPGRRAAADIPGLDALVPEEARWRAVASRIAGNWLTRVAERRAEAASGGEAACGAACGAGGMTCPTL